MGICEGGWTPKAAGTNEAEPYLWSSEVRKVMKMEVLWWSGEFYGLGFDETLKDPLSIVHNLIFKRCDMDQLTLVEEPCYNKCLLAILGNVAVQITVNISNGRIF